jgi:hypothetical protein
MERKKIPLPTNNPETKMSEELNTRDSKTKKLK